MVEEKERQPNRFVLLLGQAVQVLSLGVVKSQSTTTRIQRKSSANEDAVPVDIALRCCQQIICHHSKSLEAKTILIVCHFHKQKLSLMIKSQYQRKRNSNSNFCIRLTKNKYERIVGKARKLLYTMTYLEETTLRNMMNMESCSLATKKIVRKTPDGPRQTACECLEGASKLPSNHKHGSDPISFAACLTTKAVKYLDNTSEDTTAFHELRRIVTSLLWLAMQVHKFLGSLSPAVESAAPLVYMGQVYWRLGMLEQGHRLCQQALQMLRTAVLCSTEPKRNMQVLSKCYRYLGHTCPETSVALRCYQNELDIHERLKSDDETKASTHAEIAVCLCAAEEMETTIFHNEEALLLGTNPIGEVDIRINLANALALSGRKQEARKQLLCARSTAKDTLASAASIASNEMYRQATQQILFVAGNLGRLDDVEEKYGF